MDTTYASSLYSNEGPNQVYYSDHPSCNTVHPYQPHDGPAESWNEVGNFLLCSSPHIDAPNSLVRSRDCLCSPKRCLNKNESSIVNFLRRREPILSSGVSRLPTKVDTLKASLVLSTMKKAAHFRLCPTTPSLYIYLSPLSRHRRVHTLHPSLRFFIASTMTMHHSLRNQGPHR